MTVEKTKWISIVDAVPELYHPVIVYMNLGAARRGARFAFGWRGSQNAESGGTFYDLSTEEGGPTLTGVTHWQPMPDPPLGWNSKP